MCVKTKTHLDVMHENYFIKKRIADLGITEKYTGYYYLIEIVNLLMKENKCIRCFSKEVYPNLANKYNVRDHSIERDIRHIIKVLWELKLKNKLKNFWRNETRPTCCKFLYLVKNYVISDIA